MENRKDSCVCWDHLLNTCGAIEPNVFRRRGCKACAFFKTEEEYKAQTGSTYAEEMKKTFVYGRRRK